MRAIPSATDRTSTEPGVRALRPAAHELRGLVRRALPGFDPDLRVLAEGLPAAEGVIDLLGTDARARLVVVCIDQEGGERGGALALARALGIRRWLRAEMPGWLQLIPELDVSSETPIRLLLLLQDATGPTRSAIQALPEGWIEPLVYRPFVHRGDTYLLLEHAGSAMRTPEDSAERAPARSAAAEPTRSPGPPSQSPGPPPGAPPLPTLRSGISEADFRRARHGRRAGGRRPEAARPRYDVPGSS